MTATTSQLCDKYGNDLQVADPLLSDFGGIAAFHGPICTVKCFEDHSPIGAMLAEPGQGHILVVDGGASDRYALLDTTLVLTALDNGWIGLICHGCIRDRQQLAKLPIGLKALNVHPRLAGCKNTGERNISIHFAGVRFAPGAWVYADLDGLVVADGRLPG